MVQWDRACPSGKTKKKRKIKEKRLGFSEQQEQNDSVVNKILLFMYEIDQYSFKYNHAKIVVMIAI